MAADLCGKCLPALRWAAKARAAGSNPVFRSEGLLGQEPFFVSIDASSVLLTADTSEAHVQREPLCWQARAFLRKPRLRPVRPRPGLLGSATCLRRPSERCFLHGCNPTATERGCTGSVAAARDWTCRPQTQFRKGRNGTVGDRLDAAQRTVKPSDGSRTQVRILPPPLTFGRRCAREAERHGCAFAKR